MEVLFEDRPDEESKSELLKYLEESKAKAIAQTSLAGLKKRRKLEWLCNGVSKARSSQRDEASQGLVGHRRGTEFYHKG